MESPLLDMRQAARYLNVSLRTMHGIRQRGEIPVVVMCKRTVRFRREDLDAYIEDNVQAPRRRPRRRRS